MRGRRSGKCGTGCSRQMMSEPKSQITSMGQTALPHWMLRLATEAGARNSMALTPEVRRVPEMPPVPPDRVLRGDRDQAAQDIRPERRRADQDARH